ncbi:MAG: lysylphosphatidylglycerol synthase transmembrane domain-containing protein [Casimicrobiaceae bacterium]
MLTLIKILIGLLLLGIILWRLDVHAILHAIGSYRAEYVAASAILFLLACLIAVLRWRLFVPQFGFVALLRLSFIGQLYAMLLPGQVAGEAVKAYRIAKGQSQKTRLVASVLIDRVVGTLALLCVGAAGLWLSPRSTNLALGLSFFVLIALVCAALIVLRIPAMYLLSMRIAERLRRAGPRCARMASSMVHFFGVWRDYAMEPSKLVASFVLGLVIHCLGVAIYAILARDLGIDVALTDWLWIVAIVALAVLLPVSIAGIGLREGALVGSLGYLGVQGERAIALSFGVFALTVFGALIGWLVEITDRPPVTPENETS